MVRILYSIIILLFFIHATIQAQVAIVKIKVRDEDNLNLPGATVTLEPGGYKGFTDLKGEYLSPQVSSGAYTLKISYIGYRLMTKTIDINSGVAEFMERLEPVGKTENEVIILGDRLRGQAKALNQQRNNANISNIISSDQIGRFPDQNIGDALKRVPGITMQNDQGEARDIIIRGLAPQLNSVTMNGNRIPSAEGDNRRVQMDLIPADMIQTLEVNKTLTPDMDGDAIGGSVNLVTRSAPNKFRISTTVSGGKNPIRDGNIFNLATLVGGRLFKDHLGLVASAVINDNDYGSDNIEAVWAKRADGVVFVSEQDTRRYDVRRVRRSLNITMDYRFNKRNSITISGIYNWRDDWENRFRLRVTGITPVYASGIFTGYRGEVRVQTKGGLDNDRIRARRLEEQIVKNGSVKGEHILGKGLVLDWSSAVSRASEYRPNERYLEYNRTNQSNLIMDIADPTRPYVTTATRLGAADLNFRRFTEQFGNVFENDWTSKVNLKIPLLISGQKNSSLKVGFRYSDRSKKRENDFYRYTPTAGFLPIVRTLGQIDNSSQTIANYQAGSKYVLGPFATTRFMGGINLEDPASFVKTQRNEEFLALNYEAKEKISAVYARLDHAFSKRLSGVAGLRLEQTVLNYTGNSVLNSTISQGKRILENSYVNVLPSFNLKYESAKEVIYRFAVTTALARPGYYELVPYRNVLSSDNQISVGNPDLKPTKSINVDMLAEKYFKSVGLVSGGVFYKRLQDFIYVSVDPTYDSLDFQKQFSPAVGQNPIPSGSNWIYRTSLNGSSVDVYGFEVSFQRQLDFLPGFLKGLGVYMNYTFTQSSAEGVYNSSGVKRTGLSLPGTSPHMFNSSLSFENKKIVARISANYAAAYIDEIGDNAFYDRYYDRQFFLDFNGSYAFSKRFRLFAELNNITNQPLRFYQGVKEQTMQLEFYRLRGVAGIKFDLY